MIFYYTNKKGQLEIGVTMMVLLVFLILLIVSLIFYFRFTQESIEDVKEEVLDVKYSVFLNTIMNAPEFKCSIMGIDKECLDVLKLKSFKELIDGDDKAKSYYDVVLSGINRLSVEVVYPESGEVFLIFDNGGEGRIYSMPVALYYPELKQYKIGKLRIQAEI